MNDLNRDPAVARALDRLPVPDHGPDFWDRLELRLDQEDGLDSAEGTVRRMPRRWFEQRNLLIAVAAAMVLVLGAAVVLGVGDGNRTRVDTRANEPTTPPTTQVPATAVPGTSAPAVGRAQTRATPDAAVNDWLEALGRGDEQTAAALVGPKSRRYIESLGGNVEGFMRESEEGYGAWGASPDRSTTEIDLGTVGGTATTIVVVTGTWRGEGGEGFRSDAIPSVRIGGGWMVEPVAFDPETGGRLEVLSPTRSDEGSEFTPLAPDGVISAGAEGSGDFYFSLDDNEPVRVDGQRAGGGVQATWDPPGNMRAGSHLFVIAYVDDETLTAFAGRFRVTD